MNLEWIDFLKSNNASFTENSEIHFSDNQSFVLSNSITPIAHLAILKVSGTDAPQFLQGQLTCNINELTESNSFFSAFCNAKGRTISTFIIIKRADCFLLILPEILREKVTKKLNLYILRSDVKIENASNDYCLLGLNTPHSDLDGPLPETNFTVTSHANIRIKLPENNNRFLFICSTAQAQSLWTQCTEKGNFSINNSEAWLFQDISAGIPWLNEHSTEEYIPQMLNIDKLGGISFSKGCYTGQEIVARTHYLGKAKRELFVAECQNQQLSVLEPLLVTNKSKQTVGKVISLQSNNQIHKLLIVLSSRDAESKNLLLNNSNQANITLIDFQ